MFDYIRELSYGLVLEVYKNHFSVRKLEETVKMRILSKGFSLGQRF